MLSAKFNRFAEVAAIACGSPWAFLLSVLSVVLWALSGPLFHYSDTWQLVINTATTVITFLVVFLLQASQNRNAKAMQLKLDELIRTSSARNQMLGLEELDDVQLEALKKEFDRIKERT